MAQTLSRRGIVTGGAALVGLAALGVPEWMAAKAAQGTQGDEVVEWTDVPPTFNPNPPAGNRSLDTRTIQKTSFITPTEEFFAVQHYGPQQVDPATYRLQLTGLVDKPMSLTLDELKRRPRVEQTVGFECSGNNNPRLNMQMGNARWAGTSLARLLKEAGLKRTAREIVFFGADEGTEDIVHGGGQPQKYDQHFGRSLTVDDASNPDVLLVWDMNGAPLTSAHGAPVRLLVPGWYGVANVKWLDHIHVQETRFMGRFMARDYVTLMERKVGDDVIWSETSVSRIRLKSMVARLTRAGDRYTAVGVALNDGTPLRTVDVRVDNGPWQTATLDRENTKYSWKLFTYQWTGLPPGAHTIVSRATDVNGAVQPEETDLASKKTRWENNGQFTRRFTV